MYILYTVCNVIVIIIICDIPYIHAVHDYTTFGYATYTLD